jgi:hypothetical protein
MSSSNDLFMTNPRSGRNAEARFLHDAGAAEAAARKLPEVFVGGESGWHRQRPSHGGKRVRN